MLLLMFAAVLVLLLLLIWVCNPRTIYLTYKYPKLKSLFYCPMFGHLGYLKYVNTSIKDMEEQVETFANESGRMFFCLGVKIILFYKPQHLKVILNHPHTCNKAFFYNFLHDIMGDSLICLPDAEWRVRKKLIPSMKRRVISNFIMDVSKYAEDLAERLTHKVGVTSDIGHDISKNVFHMIINVLIGIDLSVDKIGDNLLHHIHCITSSFRKRCGTFFYYTDYIYNKTKDGRRVQESYTFVNNFTKEYIAKRRKICSENNSTDFVNEDQSGGSSRYKFMDYLINKQLPEKTIKDETILFVGAAHETSSLALSFTLLCLAMYPGIQEKAYQEVKTILGVHRSVKYSDLSRFVYLKNVVQESMRIFPPIPFVGRYTTDELYMDGSIIPKNTTIIISLLNAHRCPEQWSEPLKFDPERFSSDAVAQRSGYSYLPFLAGSRACYGTQFAYLNILTTLAILLMKFEWFTPYECIEDVKLSIGMVITCVDGFQLEPKLRK